MGNIDTTKVRRCSPLLEPPAPSVVVELCDEIDALRARVAELEANAKTLATANADNARELQERISELESALAKSASREAALVEKLRAAEEALNKIASWREGPNVTSSFDEPASAGIARIALAKEAS